MTQRPSDGFGARLATYRRLANLSAQGLSDRLGGEISRGVIANIESGRKTDVTIDQLVMLSAALAIPPIALALPTHEPEASVRTIGMREDSSVRHSSKAHQLVGWFQGKPGFVRPVPEFANFGSTLASQTIVAVDEYYRAEFHLAFLRSRTKIDEAAVAEAEEELSKAKEYGESLGVNFDG